jgi:hypothetical protein
MNIKNKIKISNKTVIMEAGRLVYNSRNTEQDKD